MPSSTVRETEITTRRLRDCQRRANPYQPVDIMTFYLRRRDGNML